MIERDDDDAQMAEDIDELRATMARIRCPKLKRSILNMIIRVAKEQGRKKAA